MYDPKLFKRAYVAFGLNWTRLGKQADVDPKTAKQIVEKGVGHPDKVYAVAKTLGLPVKQTGANGDTRYDFSAILKKGA